MAPGSIQVKDISDYTTPYFLSPEVRLDLGYNPDAIEVFVQQVPEIEGPKVISFKQQYDGRYYLGVQFPIPTLAVLVEELVRHKVDIARALGFLAHIAVRRYGSTPGLKDVRRPIVSDVAKSVFSPDEYPRAVTAFCLSSLELVSLGHNPSIIGILDIAE